MLANSGNSQQTKNGVFVIILIWVVAFCTVIYHCHEGEKNHNHRNGLHLSKVVDTIDPDGKNNVMLQHEHGESHPSEEQTVMFEQINKYQHAKSKSKEFQKLKEQLSKLESSKRKLESSRESVSTMNYNDPDGAGMHNLTAVEKLLDLETPQKSESIAEAHPEKYNLGEIRSIFSDQLCLDAREVEGSGVTLYGCHGEGGNQYWEINENGEIKRGRFCLDFGGGPLLLFQCQEWNQNQEWIYEEQLLRHSSDHCLTVNGGTELTMKLCNDSPEQIWLWRKGYKKSHLLSNNEL